MTEFDQSRGATRPTFDTFHFLTRQPRSSGTLQKTALLAMTTRNAFLPLQSFLTSVEPNVNARAHKLYNQARSKTRPGSGNDLSPDLAANITAMASGASACGAVQTHALFVSTSSAHGAHPY